MSLNVLLGDVHEKVKGENLRGIWKRGTEYMSHSITLVNTSRKLTTHQVKRFGRTKEMRTKGKGIYSKRMEKVT